MDLIFNDEDADAAPLMDTENAFNSVNREAFIHNVKIICPAFATFSSSCYSSSSRIFINGGGKLKSTEGTIQRDPIAMIIYAIATIPLIPMTIEIMHDQPGNTFKLITYADDFTAVKSLTEVKVLWNIFCHRGTKLGYYPRAFKSWLIVKKIESKEHPFC